MSGFNGTGYLFRETVAGANQFTGLVGAGKVTFAGGVNDFGLTAFNAIVVPRIFQIGYDATGAAHTVHFRLVRVGGETAGQDRIRLGGSPIQPDGTYGLTLEASVICCDGIAVPKADGGNFWYQLQVITSGKTGDATLSVWYDLARVRP